MKKLQRMIDNAYYYGKLPDGCSVSDFRELEYILYGYTDHGANTTFIQDSVKHILESCGITVKPHGIGYVTCF